MKKRIVVTGMGVVSSIGIGVEEFWKQLILGTSGISRIESFDTTKHSTHFGGEIKSFVPGKFINARKSQFMGRASQLAIVATKLALQDAGLSAEALKDYIVGVSLGTTGGEAQEIEMIDKIWALMGEENVYKRRIRQYSVDHVKIHCQRQVGVLGRNGKSCPKGKELPELYSGTFYRIVTPFPNILQRSP